MHSLDFTNHPITIEELEDARRYLDDILTPTPLIPLNASYDNKMIYLKLESLSPVQSFKLRGAYNCLRHISINDLSNGVYTASAGNWAQGLLAACNKLSVPVTILVPDSTPLTKLQAIERNGGKLVKMTFDEWWNVVLTGKYDKLKGTFIHPVANRHVIVGNATIAMEILDRLPNVDTIVLPYGGGALTSGIGIAIRLLKPSVRVIVSETSTANPFGESLAAGKPVTVDNYKQSFIDAVGAKCVLPEMFDIARTVVNEAVVVTVDTVASTLKYMAERNRVIAEGAGALPVAAAMQGVAGIGNIVCIVSGGNIDTHKLISILEGKTP